MKHPNRFGQSALAPAFGGLGIAFAPQVGAAAFVDFSSRVDAIVEVLEIDGGTGIPTGIPTGVTINYGNEIDNDEAGWTGNLSFASSDPLLLPDASDIALTDLFDSLENDHLNQGRVGADLYGISGNAYTATSSTGFIEIINESGAEIEVLISAYLDMLASVTPSTGLDAFSTVEGFAYASVQLYDDAISAQLDIEEALSATLSTDATPFRLDQEYSYTIDDGESLTFALYVNTYAGGTAVAAAVPAPATLALMAFGLIGFRSLRRSPASGASG
jgi:hypothetical protein